TRQRARARIYRSARPARDYSGSFDRWPAVNCAAGVAVGRVTDLAACGHTVRYRRNRCWVIADLFSACADIWDGGAEMKKKSLLHYELYDSSARGDKIGYWRWPIFAGREKPLSVGSFYGTLPEAKEHAEAAISRLKARNRKECPAG